MPVIGVLNGVFRGLVLMRFTSEFHAKQLSSLTLILLLLFYANTVFYRLRISRIKTAFLAGLTWVVLTIAFEFVLGYVVLQQDPAIMLQEYNVLAGNLWSLVLVAIFFLPYLLLRFDMVQRRHTQDLK